MKFNKLPQISDREKDVMSVLWHNDKPMLASEISSAGSGISINTVQGVLRKLLTKKYIEVAEIVHSGTVLSRKYRYIISSEEYAAEQLRNMSKIALNFSTLNFVNHFIKEDNEHIWDELEEIIRQRKNRSDS